MDNITPAHCKSSSVLRLPEIASLVCQHLYLDSLELPLDPALVSGSDRTRSINALTALSRVNRLFLAEARPYLYANISIALPASFETLVGTIGVSDSLPVFPPSSSDQSTVDDTKGGHTEERAGRRVNVAITAHYEERDGMLSPPGSRETSRDRDADCSPSSDFFMPISASSASSQSIVSQTASLWREDNPGLLTQTITFERFRSHGLRRTLREGSRQRFVTPMRLLQILRGTRMAGTLEGSGEYPLGLDRPCPAGNPVGKLSAVGLTEYIDSALTLSVLEEILLRGGTALLSEPRKLLSSNSEISLTIEAIKALDLCGCVSRTFVDALEHFSKKYGRSDVGSDRASTAFPHLQRLGLYNVTVPAGLLSGFVLAFPNLTHLDLGGTRTTPVLLSHLGRSPTLRLKSLSLAKCLSLTSEAIRDFLCDSASQVLEDLQELNMHFDASSPSPLRHEHLVEILSTSKVFTSGKLRYLDLATAPLDDSLLTSDIFTPQPNLIDLGLAYCPYISWRALSSFIENKAYNVEVLEVRHSCKQPVMPPARVARRNEALLNTIMGLHQYLLNASNGSKRRLRVVELDEKTLEGLDAASGSGSWRVCWGKGWRGWYVDTSVRGRANPHTGEREVIQLEKDSERRKHMEAIVKKSKNGGYNFGWHSRKMAILSEHGMLGREHGLYNFHAFS